MDADLSDVTSIVSRQVAVDFHIFVIRLNGLPKGLRERIRDLNPDGAFRTPYVNVVCLKNEEKIRTAESGDFSQIRNRLVRKYGRKVIEAETRSTPDKIEAYSIQKEVVESLRRKHWRVANDDVKNCRVYVIRLGSECWESRKMQKGNAKRDNFAGYLYVGQTSMSIEERYDVHTRKVSGRIDSHASPIVHKYHQEIAWDLFTNPPSLYTLLESLERERDLALELREQGYATIWG